MIVGYRYARRKLQEREARKRAIEVQTHGHDHGAAPTCPSDTAGTAARAGKGAEVLPVCSDASSTLRISNTADPSTRKAGTKMLTPEEQAEKHRRRSYRWKVVLGLFLPFTLQALDTTIVAAALPTIAIKFSER